MIIFQMSIQKRHNPHSFKSKCQSSVASGKLLENISESHENLQSYSSFVVAGNLNESEISQITDSTSSEMQQHVHNENTNPLCFF